MWVAIVAACLAVGLIYSGDAADGDAQTKDIVKFGDKDRFLYYNSQVLGRGSFGKVYLGFDQQTGHEVAVKTEQAIAEPYIPAEAKIYSILGPHRGIPHFFYSGTMTDNRRVMVTQALEGSLDKLEEIFHGKFSVKTCCMLGIQMMYRFEYIHSKRLVHRDIKPGNMGVGISGRMLYIFDYGLSEKYVDAKGYHVKEGPDDGGSGTPNFMSIYAVDHNTQSRRDDMESVGYVLMKLLTGTLPWYHVETMEERTELKEKANYGEILKGYPKQFVEYMLYVRKLKFAERPNYPWLRKLFRDALTDMNEKEDFMFDWIVKGVLGH